MGRPRKQQVDHCSVRGCKKPVQAKGLCWKRYQDMRRHGEIRPDVGRIQNAGRQCAAPGCSRPAKALGFCKRHWSQVNRHGQLTPELERQRRSRRGARR